MSNRITQKDIAEALNLSPITVSRVFNDRGYLSEEVRRRVLEYAREVGYEPNRGARALVRGSVYRLSIITTDTPVGFWSGVARGIELGGRQVKPLGVDVEHSIVPIEDEGGFVDAVHAAIDAECDAVAVAKTGRFSRRHAMDLLGDAGIPVLMFNVDMDHPARVGFVGPDYQRAGRLAAELIDKCLPDGGAVLVIQNAGSDDAVDVRFSDLRAGGFFQTLASSRNRYQISEVRATAEEPENTTVKQILTFLDSHPGERVGIYVPTVVTFVEGACRAAQEAGRDDAVIIGHDLEDSLLKHIRSGRITAEVTQHPMLQGYLAVRALEHIAENGSLSGTGTVIVPSQMVFANNIEDRSSLDLIHELSVY